MNTLLTAPINNYNYNQKSFRKVLSFTFILLIIAHGAYNTLVPFFILNVFTLIIISFLIYVKFISKGKVFETLLIIYICSHFYILDKWGGLFVLTSFLVLGLYFSKFKMKIKKDTTINFLIGIFILTNLFGWIFKNKVEYSLFLLGIFSFIAYLMVFYVSKSIRFGPLQIASFIKAIIFVLLYELIVSLNTYFGLIKTELTHLFPTNEMRFGLRYMTGTFGHSELYGEYSLLMFLFLLPFSFSNEAEKIFGVKRLYLLLGLVAAIINISLSASRSAFGLLFLGTILFILISKSKIKLKNYFIYGTFIFFILFLLWKPLKLGFIIERFVDPKQAAPLIIDNDFNIITGEGTARELAFSYFWKRFPEENWIIGYGFGVPKSNRIAWFKDPETPRADYHSLYLSLIMLYGYIGSIVYILIILVTIIRLYRLLKAKHTQVPYRLAATAFFLVLVFLLINEYKVSLLRMPHYHLLTWLWLGFSNALYYINKNNYNENNMVSTISYK